MAASALTAILSLLTLSGFCMSFMGIPTERKIVIRSMNNCEGPDVPAMTLKNVHIYEPSQGVFLMKGELTVSCDLDHLMAEVDVWSCGGAGGTAGDCEHAHRWPLGAVCERLHEKGQLYSAFLQGVRPALACPLRPGTHEVAEAPVHASASGLSPLPEGLYRMRLELRDPQRSQLAACVVAHVEISLGSA